MLKEILTGLYYIFSLYLGFFEFSQSMIILKQILSNNFDQESLRDKLCMKFAFWMIVSTTLIIYPISKLYIK